MGPGVPFEWSLRLPVDSALRRSRSSSRKPQEVADTTHPLRLPRMK
jgi:hypothetical protein